MKVKKVLSLLTLIFLIFFLVIPAFPGGNPGSDADPWNESTIQPVPRDSGSVIILVGGKFFLLAPYFVVMKVQIPSTPKVTGGSSSAQARVSSVAGR